MSFLTSTHLARPQYVLAIAGITGNLGQAITPIFLSSYKVYFPTIIGLVRDPTSPAAKSLAAAGVEIRKVSEDDANSVVQALQGVDILVNALGSKAAAFKGVVAEATVKADVKVYFLSEFGIDHQTNPFPGYEHHEWTHKAQLDKQARALAGDKVKVIALYNAPFLEDFFGPWWGFDHAHKTFTSIGSPTQRISVTSKADVARALAELSILALSTNAATVPNYVRISGDAISFQEAKTLLERVRAELGDTEAGEIIVKSEDLESFRANVKEQLQSNPNIPPLGHLRILSGEGALDFSSENSNELINPGGGVWKWKTVENYFREVKGKPFN